MAYVFGRRRNAETGAGGKILRNRKPPPAERTPYSRPKSPESPPSEHPENPNWLAGLTYPVRLIATAAGKVISTIFGPDSQSSSSSSSLGDSDSGAHDDGSEDDVSIHENTYAYKELSSSTTKSANKRLIAQLVSQEEFSREESKVLIKLIESHVVDDKAARLNRTVDRSYDVCSSAITESKKWLQEKKLGSGSNPRIGNHVRFSSLATLPKANEAEVGSPVAVGKSYIQTRPPWASPLLKYVGFKTPSPALTRQSIDEPPLSIFSSSLQSSELKQSSLKTGSWNISEEIRNVRSKGTEELLASASLKNIDATLSPLDQSSSKCSLENNRYEMETDNRLHNLNSAVSDLETNMCVDLGDQDHRELPVAADSNHYRSQEALLTDAADSVAEQIKGGEVNKNMDREDAAIIIGALLSQRQFGAVDAYGQSEGNGLMNSIVDTGLQISKPSLAVQGQVDQNQDLATRDDEIRTAGDLGQCKDSDINGASMEDNLTRDTPTANGNASLRRHPEEESTSLQLEELSQDSDQQNTKQGLTTIKKKTWAPVTRRRGYPRRVRGRGGK